jgi:hypothetical protein
MVTNASLALSKISYTKLLQKYYLSVASNTQIMKQQEVSFQPEPAAHTCNPSYSGGRDREDHSSKPAQTNSSQDPISKKPTQK